MPQQIVKIKGKYTYPSEISEVPDGSLLIGRNISINRDSVAEPRPGFKYYKSISASTSDRLKQMLTYRNTILGHFTNTLCKDGADPFTSVSSSLPAPTHGDSYVPKIKSVEVNGNFYITCNSGLQKLDSISGTLAAAGLPRGLDTNLTLTGASGFMTNDTQVAYRIVWGRRDANSNVILGAPGQRVTIANSSGGTRDVIVNFSVPSGISTTDFFQIYRSALSSTAATSPNDETNLVYEGNASSTDISNKYVQITDSTPDDLRGAVLYTSASQEGILKSNDIPPSAKDLALFKNCLFAANTIQKQRLTITLLSAGGSSGFNYRSFTGNTTLGSPSVTTVSSTTGLAIGQKITGTGIPASTTITNIVGTTLTLSANATATAVGVALEAFDYVTINSVDYDGASAEDVANRKFKVTTSGTPGQNIADTAQSLCKVINRYTSNTTIYAYYLSADDELPGKIFLEARSLGQSIFYATASSHGTAWNPQLPTSGTTVASDAEEKKNRLYVSKVQQPEAFPLLQYYAVGAADKAILRVLPLRESLIILKEDGAYRLTGTDPTNFNIDILDSTCLLIGPETAVVLNNQIHCTSNQGVTTINDAGVGVISRPIEDEILPLLSYSNFAATAFGIAYETARQYILCVPTSVSDTFSKKQHIYNTFTQAWTDWDKQVTCGLVNISDGKLYFGDALSNKITQERRANDYTDFADEEIAVNILSISGATLTLDTVDGLLVGDALVQSGVPYALITDISQSLSQVTMDLVRPLHGSRSDRSSLL
jgi:hypothetical protein